MRFTKELLQNKDTYSGRVDATMFFANLFLILVHLLLMFFYIAVNHSFMIYLNTISILYYLFSYKFCVNYKDLYMSFALTEIWIHMLCGTVSFGWHASFQNWIFAIIAAVFLPAFNTGGKQSYTKPLIFSGFVIISYFLFSVLINVIPFKIQVELGDIALRTIFTFNNFVSFFALIMFAITFTMNKERKEFELTRKADFDELTEMYNRHALDELGSNIIEKCKELNRPFSVAILDIDFFKKVNDKYGHGSGDLVLKQLSKILVQFSSKSIISGRWGGEEFIMIGSYDIKYNDFINVLKKLRIKVSKTKFRIENNKKINITISVGVASIYDFKTLEEAVSIADNNLYKAKHSGRNKVVYK